MCFYKISYNKIESLLTEDNTERSLKQLLSGGPKINSSIFSPHFVPLNIQITSQKYIFENYLSMFLKVLQRGQSFAIVPMLNYPLWR